jgi:hypothetical protein
MWMKAAPGGVKHDRLSKSKFYRIFFSFFHAGTTAFWYTFIHRHYNQSTSGPMPNYVTVLIKYKNHKSKDMIGLISKKFSQKLPKGSLAPILCSSECKNETLS